MGLLNTYRRIRYRIREYRNKRKRIHSILPPGLYQGTIDSVSIEETPDGKVILIMDFKTLNGKSITHCVDLTNAKYIDNDLDSLDMMETDNDYVN